MKEETFGEKLQELLDWTGMTKSELARRSGITPGAVSSYLHSGTRPAAETAKRMAEALGVSLSTLMGTEPLSLQSLELTEREGLLISKFRTLAENQQEMVEAVIEVYIGQNRRIFTLGFEGNRLE